MYVTKEQFLTFIKLASIMPLIFYFIAVNYLNILMYRMILWLISSSGALFLYCMGLKKWKSEFRDSM